MIAILWPERRLVPPEMIMTWASDAVANGDVAGPPPTDIEDAIEILDDAGLVTFARRDEA